MILYHTRFSQHQIFVSLKSVHVAGFTRASTVQGSIMMATKKMHDRITISHPRPEEVIGHRMHALSIGSMTSRSSVYEGMLYKRCRVRRMSVLRVCGLRGGAYVRAARVRVCGLHGGAVHCGSWAGRDVFTGCMSYGASS